MSADLQSIGFPPDSVRAVGTADGAVLLDIRQGICVSLTSVGAEIWDLLKSGTQINDIVGRLSEEYREVPSGQIRNDVEEFIAGLRAKELLLCRPPGGEVRKVPKFLLVCQRLHALFLQRSLVSCRALFWKSLFWLVIFDVFGFGEDFPTIHAFIKNWSVRSRPASRDIVLEVCQAMNRACVVYPKRVMCLQRSMATTCLLRSCGVNASFVVGAQKFPFKAHAWTEVNDQPVNERRDVRAYYLVWERC